MATRLSQSEIQEITRLLEQGKVLPEKYRDVLFVDQQIRSENSTAGNPEPAALAERPVEPPQPESNKTNSTTAFSMATFGKFLLDDPRIQQMVSKYVGMVAPRNRNELNLATNCTNEIIEIVPQILQQSGNDEYFLRWLNTKLPKDSRRQLLRAIHERLIQRAFEMTKEREAKEKEREVSEKLKDSEAVEGLQAKYAEIVNMFLVIAERKVSVLDEYGDERIYLLGKEADNCVAKIAGREGFSEVRIREELKNYGGRFSRVVPKELIEFRKMLPDIFTKYHAEQKGKKKTVEEMASLSGIDFETAVGRVLSEHGWHVSATAATGDQGADIIASKGERRVIIQAKRYSGAVGNKAVQEVVGAIPFYGGTEGCVVTNSTFTPAARALAQKNNIRLIDGFRFGELSEL
jgi:HJR/Mrr/RecB family endonuclease